MDYKEKYIKYKKKYLSFKNDIFAQDDNIKKKYLSFKNDIIGGNRILEMRYPEPRKSDIYYMGSHGCDTDEEYDVPKGCVYVTFAECSIESNIDNTYFKFLKMFSNNDILLKDPIQNLEKLQKIFGKSLHIHYPEAKDTNMRKYFNNIYPTYFVWDNGKDGCSALKSGLYSIGTNIIITGEDTLENDGGKHKKLPSYIKLNNIEYLYKDSLYPTVEDLIKIKHIDADDEIDCLKFEQFIDDFKIDQNTLFKYFPGIHYNFACRSDCKNKDMPSEKHLLRRQNSYDGDFVERGFLLYDKERKGIHYYLKENNLKKVEELIDEGTYINELNEKYKTPLNLSCDHDSFKYNINLAKLLIKKGALIDKETYQMCYLSRDRELFELLVSANVERLKTK